jgi:CheY-like chemotaxis protein
MRVLVVEDETDLGEVFRDFLSELGHQPVLVRSAEAALGKLQSDRPDAIILDIHLPGMSGLDFLQLRPVREAGINRMRDEQARRAERRQSPRVPLELPVTLNEYRGASWRGTCVELSVNGMKVKTQAPLATGLAIKCSFTPPDDGVALDVISLVLRIDADGAALSFVNLPGHEARRLGEIVRRLTR